MCKYPSGSVKKRPMYKTVQYARNINNPFNAHNQTICIAQPVKLSKTCFMRMGKTIYINTPFSVSHKTNKLVKTQN